MTQPTLLPSPLCRDDLVALFNRALAEDVGSGDATCKAIIEKQLTGKYLFNAREEMVMCGLPIMQFFYEYAAPDIHFTPLCKEGEILKKGQKIAHIVGPLTSILSTERVVLNLIQHISGIATHTRKFVEAMGKTTSVLLDTRKTTPGLRLIEKYATKTGGAQNHRMGLYDAIMVKDNHIALAGSIENIMANIERFQHEQPQPVAVIIECDHETQVEQAIKCGAKHILLDNMTPKRIRSIMLEFSSTDVKFEASGGINLKTIVDYAATNVHYISSGSLTQSAMSVDIGLDVESL